jgi:SHS2 domain-containing protein
MKEDLTRAGSRGHALRPHTADVVIEAWAPTASACYEEAVAAFLDAFVDTSGSTATTSTSFDIGPGRPEVLLVMLLEEVLVLVEVDELVPSASSVEARGERLLGTFSVVPAAAAEVTGSIPKGVSYQGLVFSPAAGGWRCRATVDV